MYKMVFDKVVEARPVTTDRYKRTIAWIYVDGTCLNKALLKVGLAFSMLRFFNDKVTDKKVVQPGPVKCSNSVFG
jgi:endonuclease YncB( thermonuclease family)